MNLDGIVSYWGIGSGDPKLLPRRVQFLTPETGWQGFVDKFIQPQRALGVRRFMLWMPFGQDELRVQWVNDKPFDTRVRFDQFQQAWKTGLRHLTDGFARAIRPLTEEGCQVIAYTGTLGGAPEYENERWYQKRWVEDCLAPFKGANCDIAIDSAVRSPLGNYVSKLVGELRFWSNAKIYAEAMPYTEAPHWAAGDIVSTEEQYQAALHPGNRGTLCDPATIKGELIRMFTSVDTPLARPYFDKAKNAMDWAAYYKAKVPAALRDNHTVCLHLRHYLAQGGKLEELMT